MSGMKTIDKIMDSKLDKLPTHEWAIAHQLWYDLRAILNGEGIEE